MNRYKDKEIESIFAKVYELGALTERAMADAVWAMSHRDKALAKRVLDGDDAVDNLAAEINAASFELIARHQPVAFDLRALEACIRMAIDLERITDLAVNIARMTLNADVRLTLPASLEPMGNLVVEMLNLAMAALLKRDVAMAERVCAMDDEVDDYENELYAALMRVVVETPEAAGGGTRLILAARVLERAGDHTTNLAEQVCYLVTGLRVKASAFRRRKAEV